jgi:hypothetical protein
MLNKYNTIQYNTILVFLYPKIMPLNANYMQYNDMDTKEFGERTDKIRIY